MKKLTFPFSTFDLGFVIAFVVVTLLGGGAYWYLTGELAAAQQQDDLVKKQYDTNSRDPKYKITVSPANIKILQENIDVLKGQIDPLIPAKLEPKENKLSAIQKEDPVAWKHDLDEDVHRLTAAAQTKKVGLPPNFYFGFSRYLSQSPGDEQTAVLSKQLVGVDQIANILIKSPVKSIESIARTYEEDTHTGSTGGPSGERDHMPGFSFSAPNDAYVSYPFETEFVTTPENLRGIFSDLVQAPYLFVIRTVSVTNSAANSPQINGLDALAGNSATPGGDTSPGAASGSAARGPQYLFGQETITVKMRVDMIEWKGGQ